MTIPSKEMRRVWQRIRPLGREYVKDIPACPGIYAIFVENGGGRGKNYRRYSMLYYIGQSTNLSARVSCHCGWGHHQVYLPTARFRQSQEITEVAYRVERKRFERRMAEGRLLERLCPIGNTMDTGRKRRAQLGLRAETAQRKEAVHAEASKM